MTTLIEVSNLRKQYRSSFGKPKITALDGIDFQVKEGELFGLLGPNGAGKTTTVKILLGLTHATEGHASVCGLPVRNPESRRRVGYLPEGHKIPNYLTARQALSIFGRMSGMTSADIAKRIPHLLDQVRMTQWADVRIKKFSKGMTQRIGLACSMVHSPQVLLLDEPTDGVDPVGRREIRDILQNEAKKGKAILLNSHLLSEIELMCDRVAVLRKGKIAAIGSIEELTKNEEKYRMKASPVDERLLSALRETGAGVQQQNGHLVLSVRDIEQLNAMIDRVRANGSQLSELVPVRSSLEDVFVDLVKMTDETTTPKPEQPN
jgi:ABC-2 type transport system ATP-binding protein